MLAYLFTLVSSCKYQELLLRMLRKYLWNDYMLNDETPESISVTLRLAIITEKPMNKGMQVIYESMRVKCAKLFLVGFFFLFFLRDAESCMKFEYGGNCKTSNPFVTTCCEHECSGENQG